MRKRIAFLFLFLCFAFISFSQSPYEINLKKDLPLLGLGAAGTLSGVLMEANLDPLSAAEIAALNPDDVNSFDRKGIYNYSKKAEAASDVFLYGLMACPFSLLASKQIRNDYITIGVLGAEAFLWNAAFTTISKGLVKRERPFAYNPEVSFEEKNKINSRLSFYSGHTSVVSVLSFFSAKVFSDYYPESKWKYLVWTSAVILPATTGYFRYKAGKHFKTDVITGVLAGAVVGVLIPHLHKKKRKDQKIKLSFLTQNKEFGLVLQW